MGAALPVPAVLLAGGKTTPEFAREAGTAERALADVNGRPMVRYVIEALKAAETVDRIILVAPPGFPEQPGVDRHVASAAGLVGNIRAGLRECGDAQFALFATADIPFLTGAAIDDHLRACAAADV